MKTFNKIRKFIKDKERYIGPIAIFGGFIIDSLTLQRIDLLFENLILGGYLFLSGILVLVISFIDDREIQNNFLIKIRPILGVVLLFLFGGVFSGFTIFYTRSASIWAAWPFLIILLGLMIATEYAKKYFTKTIVQVSIFYFALFTYLIFLVPIIIKQIGAWTFVLSGVISLALVFLYIQIFKKIIGIRFNGAKRKIWISITSIFVLINILYFTNIIPPIPLSLKDSGAYLDVSRTETGYQLLTNKEGFFEKIIPGETVEAKQGSPVYFFSSIFAPTKIKTQIFHRWEYKNDDGDWVTVSRSSFGIFGGRDGGYRGFSFLTSPIEGKWRVSVETNREQIIGRKTFNIKHSTENQELIYEEG